MPQFEHHETPDWKRVVVTARKKFGQIATNAMLVEISTLNCARIQQQCERHFLEFIPQPMKQRQGKSLFRGGTKLRAALRVVQRVS